LVATGKKTFIATIIVTVLLLALIGVQFVEVAKANFGPIPQVYIITDIASPINGTTYNTPSVSFTFRIDILNPHPQITTEWVTIYLDNNPIKTIYYLPSSYKMTLENLTNGLHHLEISANAVAITLSTTHRSGNNTVNFSIQLPSIQPTNTSTPTTILTMTPIHTPSPTPSPRTTSTPSTSPTLSPAITQQSTIEPTQTLIADSSSVWIPYSIVGLVAAIIFVVVVYFVRQKRRV
jgi:hypothetical protein